LKVIDTLTSGFNLIYKKPYLVIIPILLDLILLFGPKVSMQPTVDQIHDLLIQNLQETSDLLAIDDIDLIALEYDSLANAGSEFNILALVPVSNIVIPSVSALVPIDLENDNVLYLYTAGQSVGVVLGTLLFGLFMGCVYWSLIAEDVRGHQQGLGAALKSAPGFWIQLIKFVGILLLLGIGLLGLFFLINMLAAVLMMTGLTAIAQIILLLAELFIAMLVFWAFLYLYFVPQAITLTHAHTREAMRASIMIVRINLGPSLGIILLTALIRTGMSYLWTQLTISTWGIIGAILGNAIIGTGLIAAVFVFFRDQVIAVRERMSEGSVIRNA